MKMSLWLWYAPGSDAQIAEACQGAEKVLQERGITVNHAFAATVAANDLDESHTEDTTPDAPAVAAWYAAEFEALTRLSELTGEWPAQAALIVTEGSA